MTTVKASVKLFFKSMHAQRLESPLFENCESQPWFALRVRSNQERTAIAHLRERGYQQFAPSYKSARRWSDRTKEIDEYLFPGYIFCRFDPGNRRAVLTAPGVVDLVGFGKTPEAIPDEEIDRVRRMVESGLLVTPYPFLNVGQAVVIDRGPLDGLQGILVEMKGKHRLVVSINMLQRSVSAEVERRSVRPARPGVLSGVGSFVAGIHVNPLK